MHLRSTIGDVVDVVDIVTVGGTPALLAYSAGVGAVELLAVSMQRVLDQMVDSGWIKKHYTFHSVDRPCRLS